MITVGQHEEHILENWQEELSEEDARSLRISLGHVVHELQAHGQAGVLNLAVVVLAGPHARIDHKLELAGIELQQGREAVQVDRLQQLEELNAMLRVFMEVLVDHVQGAFEDAFHDGGHFVFHQILLCVSEELII